MKLAEVIQLFKGKETYLMTNYRPVSLLITISKILEKIIYKQLYNFLENTNILYKSQHGFWKLQSCSQAITKLLGETLKKHGTRQIYGWYFFRPIKSL